MTHVDENEPTEVERLRSEIERVKWVVEVHLSRHGLWDEQVGLDVRGAWLAGEEQRTLPGSERIQ